MKDFDAKKVKEIADNYYNAEFEGIKKEIIDKAEANGKYKLEVKRELSEITLSKLQNLGFYIDQYIPADREKTGIFCVISWKTG